MQNGRVRIEAFGIQGASTRESKCDDGSRLSVSSNALNPFQAEVYPISMLKPSCGPLVVTRKFNPGITLSTQTLPCASLAFRSTDLLRLLISAFCNGRHSASEGWVVPDIAECQPMSGCAEATPSFAFFDLAPNPARCVKIAVEVELPCLGNQIRITRVEVFWWWVSWLVTAGSAISLKYS